MSQTDDRPRVVEPTASPETKETIIKFAKVDERAHLFTEQRGIMSRLLRHPEFNLGAATLKSGERVKDRALLDETDTVIRVEGSVPVGSLKILANARQTSQLAPVVSEAGER